MPKILSLVLFAICLLSLSVPVQAQDTSNNPVYVIQSGDTLNVIASRFGVSVADLIAANNIQNPDVLTAGTELIIPGLTGISGKLVTTTVPLGYSLDSISKEYQISINLLTKLNRITSPAEVYAGTNLIIPQDQKNSYSPQAEISPLGTLLDIAVSRGVNPWLVSYTNQLQGMWDLPPGSLVYMPATDQSEQINTISPWIKEINISPLPLKQGVTTEIKVVTRKGINLAGSLSGNQLHFFPLEPNIYIAFQGINALADQGLTPFEIKGSLTEGNSFDFAQMVLVENVYYPSDPKLIVDPATLDKDINEAEENELDKLTQQDTATRYWDGPFKYPVDEPCLGSGFGNRRDYNNGTYVSFHSGQDFTVCADNLNIYAPAPGVIVFAGPLTVRGNYTLIDHGWGVFSGYAHQSDILVKVGEKVDVGQQIGHIGQTGRVTGPHLHWEIRINGVGVNPVDWIKSTYP